MNTQRRPNARARLPRANGAPHPREGASRRIVARRLVAASVIVAVALVAPGGARLLDFALRIGAGALLEKSVAQFYASPVPSPAAAEPGTIERQERVAAAPAGTVAWRILYHSVDVDGTDTLVSGLVIAPNTLAPESNRTVVSWAHPTTGTAARCAPSSGIAPFSLIEGLTDLIAAGNIVVAADYAGMGIAGPPSFLIGVTEAANVLDIVRAARTIDTIHASNRVVLWGHSQGGHAALFAAQEAEIYAPELEITGVAVAAPATDLGALLKADEGDVSGVTIGAYAFDSYSRAYPSRLPIVDPLSGILTSAGATAVPAMAKLCLLGQNRELHAIATPLIGSFLNADPDTAPGWKEILAENTPTQAPLAMPLFVAQGGKDTLVRPEITAAYVAAQTQGGTTVESHVLVNSTHATVALDALPSLLTWMRSLHQQ